MILSNRTINTQIWCLLLDQVCPNEHHLPVPLPYIHCDRGGVGRGGGSSSSSSLLISPLTKFVHMNITYSWCPMVVEWNLLSNRTINTQIWCLLLDQVCPNEHHLSVSSLAYIVAGVGVILLLLIANHTNSEWPLGWGGRVLLLLLDSPTKFFAVQQWNETDFHRSMPAQLKLVPA